MGRKSKLKRTLEHNEKIARKFANRDEESRLIQEKRATMKDPLATNVSFRRLTPAEVEQERAGKRSAAIEARQHFGDPCEFCNLSYDEGDARAAQPCPGIRPTKVSTDPLMIGIPYSIITPVEWGAT